MRSPALEKVLIEYGIRVEADGLRGNLLDGAKPLGYIRWTSIRCKLRLYFDDLDFESLADPGLVLPIDACVSAVIANTRGCTIAPEKLSAAARKSMLPTHDPWHVCCGHDVVALLAVYAGRQSGRRIHPVTMASALRLAFEFVHFQATRLCAAIRAWEEAHAGWQILREPR